MFGEKNKNGRHFTPPAGDKAPAAGLGPSPTTTRIDVPTEFREVLKYRFAEIVSVQEAMGVLASIGGQKKRSMWDWIVKSMPELKGKQAQVSFDEKEVPFIEVYS